MDQPPARSRSAWAVAWLTSLLAAGTALLSPSVAAAASPAEHATVISRLSFDADRSGDLEVTETTSLSAPVFGTLSGLFEDGSPAAERAEHWLESDFGVFSPTRLFERASAETATVEAGRIEAQSSVPLLFFPGENGIGGPFEIKWGDRVRVITLHPRSAPRTEWVAVLELDQTTADDLRPMPTSLVRDGSGMLVTWRFPPGKAEPIEATLHPPWAVNALAAESSNWTGVLDALAYVILALLFVPVFLLLSRRGDLAARVPDQAVLDRQLKSLAASALLTIAVGLVILARDVVEAIYGDYPGWSAAAHLPFEILPGLLAVACAATIFAAGRRRVADRWIVWSTLASMAVLLFGFVVQPVTLGAVVWGGDLEGLAAVLEAGVSLVVAFAVINGLLRVWLYWLEGERDEHRMLGPFWLRTDLLSALLAIGVSLLQWRGDALTVLIEIPFFLANLTYVVAPLLSLALLTAAGRFLLGARAKTPFLASDRGGWLLAVALYLFFVVPTAGYLTRFAVPIPLLAATATFAALAGLRVVRLDRLESEVRPADRDAAATAPDEPRLGSVLIEHRRELVERAVLTEKVQRSRAAAHHGRAKDKEPGETLVSVKDEVARLDRAERYLQTGEPPPGATPSERDRKLVKLRFPKRPPILYPALGLGPGDDWRQNGLAALRLGAPLILFPLAYSVFLLIRHEQSLFVDSQLGLEEIYIFGSLASEIALWVVAIVVFGCLYSWLPGANGLIKGFSYFLPLAAGVALGVLCPVYVADSDWVLRALELLVVVSILGLLLDRRTVLDAGLHWRNLAELYQLRSVRFGVVNLIPLVVAIIGIYQEIHAGNPQKAVEEALDAIPKHIGGQGH